MGGGHASVCPLEPEPSRSVSEVREPALGPCPLGSRPSTASGGRVGLGPCAPPHSSEGWDPDPAQEAHGGFKELPAAQAAHPPHLSPPLRGPLLSGLEAGLGPSLVGPEGLLRRSLPGWVSGCPLASYRKQVVGTPSMDPPQMGHAG